MSTLVMIDGQIVPKERATVSVFDRGFLYGDSVFETLATRGGVAVDLDAHLERLSRSASQVHIGLPVPREQLAQEVRRAAEASGFPECSLRVMVTRGSGELGLDPGLASHPLRVILVSPLKRPPEEWYSSGISAISYRTQRMAEATDAVGAKVGNYLVAVLAMERARAVGAAEALVLDGAGNVVEGATSNVFVVRAGKLVTPPEEAGILPGITRRRLLEIAAELGVEVELRSLPLPELMAAEEVFISSSIREVLGVVEVDGKPIANGRPGAMTQRLLVEYQRRTTPR